MSANGFRKIIKLLLQSGQCQREKNCVLMFIIEKSANDDGISFVGGCSPQAQPAAIRQCNPACRKPFSYCTQVSPCRRFPPVFELLCCTHVTGCLPVTRASSSFMCPGYHLEAFAGVVTVIKDFFAGICVKAGSLFL